VTVAHLSRVPLLAQAELLEPVADQFTAAGITEDKFTPAAWEKATVDGTTYAVPLDTHPFVLYYNTELAEQAGLLDESGENLKPMRNSDDFVAALQAMKDSTGNEYAAVASITVDPSTCWRLFMMVYSGLAGPIVEDLGTTVTIDRAAMEESFAFLQGLTGEQGLLPRTATSTTASTLFSNGGVGFLFDGVWQIPTYREVEGLDFNVVPFPALLGPEPVGDQCGQRPAGQVRQVGAVGQPPVVLDKGGHGHDDDARPSMEPRTEHLGGSVGQGGEQFLGGRRARHRSTGHRARPHPAGLRHPQ